MTTVAKKTLKIQAGSKTSKTGSWHTPNLPKGAILMACYYLL